MNMESINVFKHTSRGMNDENNKVREQIIKNIINNEIPEEYYLGLEWQTLREGVKNYLSELITKPYQKITCQTKAGRKYNYDFCIVVCYDSGETEEFHVEFKFNATCLDNIPQFVSPMKPSQYLSQSYEKFYFDKYLPQLSAASSLVTIPTEEEYMKQIHSNKPKCMKLYQDLYYRGCPQSSQFSNNPEDIQFYSLSKQLSKESIQKFIEETELNTELLSQYLYDTQKGKIYMLYSNDRFALQIVDMNDYVIESVVKNPEKSRYECMTKNGKQINILLRWKNGNGIAFPAFQIS
jgi:hypothetical protein